GHRPVPLFRFCPLRGASGERVIRIAGVHKIGGGGAQRSCDLLDRSSNYAARLAGLNLALQLEEPPIGAIETLRQDRRNIEERDRVYPKHGGRIGDVKLRGFKRTYIGRVRLIQQHGEFAEHGARLRHPGDLNAFLYDRDRALLKDQQPVGCRGGAENGVAGPVSHERKGGKLPLENGLIGNQGRRHVRSSVAVAGRHSKTNGSLSIFVGRYGAMNPAGRVRCNMGTTYGWLTTIATFTGSKPAFCSPRLRS